jgi:hypothetical protein
MPRKVSKKRKRKTPPVTPWVIKYKRTRIPPEKGQPGYDDFLGWYFFGEHIEGLPADWQKCPPKLSWEIKNATKDGQSKKIQA